MRMRMRKKSRIGKRRRREEEEKEEEEEDRGGTATEKRQPHKAMWGIVVDVSFFLSGELYYIFWGFW